MVYAGQILQQETAFSVLLGTLVLSGGGTLQGVLGHDEAFTLSLASGIAVIYAGFLVAARPAPATAIWPRAARTVRVRRTNRVESVWTRGDRSRPTERKRQWQS